jgi:hypothetical protein
MTLMLELPEELERELSSEASRLGLELPQYALMVLTTGQRATGNPRTGRELVAYWQDEQLVGAWSHIDDSQAYARSLRHQAEARQRDS